MRINRLLFVLIFSSLLIQMIEVKGNGTGISDTKKDTIVSEDHYTNLNNQFILRFFGLYKSNIVDIQSKDKTARFRPNGTFSMGVGFNYKFLSLGFSYGVPKSKTNNEKYGTTQRLDAQFSIFSKAFGLDGFLQAYKGYYLSNPGDFGEWDKDKFPQLPDMRVLTLGINAFYLLNNKKFSYRAAFVGNQVQNKSAGSIAVGLFGTLDQLKTDNGFLPPEMEDSTGIKFDLKSFEALTIGISAGYMYTFVLGKGFFISLAAVPGVGYRWYKIKDVGDNIKNVNQIAFHLLGRIAIGYNRGRYFLNFNSIFNVRKYKYDPYELSMSTEQLKLTFGIRFVTKASKKRGQYYPGKK